MQRPYERPINLPNVIMALIGVLIFVQIIIAYGPDALAHSLYQSLIFVPARLSLVTNPQALIDYYQHSNLAKALDFSEIAISSPLGIETYLTLMSYAFVHGSWTHLLINILTLAAFGSPIARRLGAASFLVFMTACAIAGALTHYMFHWMEFTPVVGASAAISGAMAAVTRFIFTPDQLRPLHNAQRDINKTSAETLSELKNNKSAVVFIMIWFVSNICFGLFPRAFGVNDAIAWEAHTGGFMFGLLFFGFFDKITQQKT